MNNAKINYACDFYLLFTQCHGWLLPLPKADPTEEHYGNEQGAGLPTALTGIHLESNAEKLGRIRRNMGLGEVLVFTWLWRYQEKVEEIPVFVFFFFFCKCNEECIHIDTSRKEEYRPSN